MTPPTILVIGGTRFIGPHVVRRLRDLGADVTVLHRKNCGDASHIHADRSQAAGSWDAIVENVADAMALATIDPRTAEKTYNVGDVDAPSEREWVQMLGGRVNIVKESPLPFDWRYDLVTDSSAIRRDLGYAERVSREEAIARTIALKH
jgi:nucleoside-diphosphate-sugar epimerase